MKRAALGLLVAMSPVATSLASAGGYLGVGIGTGPALSRDSESNVVSSTEIESDGRSARLLGGFRIGRFAIEAALGGFDAAMQVQSGGSYYQTRVYQGSLSAKYSLPLSDGFEAFGRAGLHKTTLGLEDDERFDAEGSGLVLGAGIEFRVPATGVGVWIDYQYSRASLEGELVEGDLSARMWTLGATIGF